MTADPKPATHGTRPRAVVARGCARRGGGFGAMLGCCFLAAACGRPDDSPRTLARSERLGILRDLVLVPRPARLGGPFLLDRFETTCADFEAWLDARDARSEERADYARWNVGADPELPVIGIDLEAARRFAAWRFGRLPRVDEWRYAASADGRHVLPWGDAPRSTWANTEELGLWRLAPVGAFESGRAPNGSYDLVGNAAEWTESVASSWSNLSLFSREPTSVVSELMPMFGPSTTARRLGRSATFRDWLGFPVPTLALIGFESPRLPRVVVRGLDGGLPRPRAHDPARVLDSDIDVRMPSDRSWVVGMRVASDLRTLLDALTALDGEPDAAEIHAIREFLHRVEVRGPLRDALRRDHALIQRTGSVARLVIAELGA